MNEARRKTCVGACVADMTGVRTGGSLPRGRGQSWHAHAKLVEVGGRYGWLEIEFRTVGAQENTLNH
jgi:hypothetical protein